MRKTSLDILDLLSRLRDNPGLHNVDRLAEDYNIRSNEVYRWCKYLQERYGVEIEKSNTSAHVPKRHIRLAANSRDTLHITLTNIELDALMIAAERIKPLTPLIAQAIEKLSKAKRLQNYKEKPSILHTPIYDEYASDPSEILERVIEAIRDRHVAEVRYHNSRNQTTEYKFNSYAIVPHHQHLYLVGVSHLSIASGDNTIIRLRLDQIKAFKLTTEHFATPNFDVDAYAAQDFGVFSGAGKSQAIKVQFSSEKAQYIRRTKRHRTQQVKDNKDGSVVWSIQAPLSDDLVYWVVSYGPHARVLAPKEFRTRVLEWAKGAIDANS